MTAKRFSEEMWFKHGDDVDDLTDDLDRDEAQYEDDGTLSADERARYNLRTGRTEPVRALRDAPAAALVIEPSSHTRQIYFALTATALIVAIGVLARILT